MCRRPSLKTSRTALACAALLLFQPLSQGAIPPFYTVTPVVGPFGPMGGVALNDMGMVLGGYVEWPFLWSRTGIAPILQSGSFSAWGMNNDGTVVGQARVVFDNGPQWVAARWQSGTVTVLSAQDPAGLPANGVALGINQQGWTVGITSVVGGPSSVSSQQGMLWSPTNQALSLGDWTPAAINGQNVVVGGHSVAGALAPAWWTAADGLRELPLPGGATGSASGINEGGQVVGSFTSRGGQDRGSGFLWSADTGLQVLAAPEGSFSSVASALNDRGQAVGHSLFLDGSQRAPLDVRFGAVLWDNASAAPVHLAPLARLPGGGTLADAGLWLTQAVDINAQGQVLVIGSRLLPVSHSPTGEMTLTNFEAYVLSPCLRCGQILPTPNPGGQQIDVGPDWEDAYNALHFENVGRLRIDTVLDNRAGASITNQGQIGITGQGQWLNSGQLRNQRGASLFIDGAFSSLPDAGVVNAGAVVLRDGSSLTLRDSHLQGGWLNDAGASFTQLGGEIVNRGSFVSTQTTLHLEGGSFSNHGEVMLLSSTASVASTFANQGRVTLLDDIVAAPGRRTEVAVLGQFQNLAGGTAHLQRGAQLRVELGGQWINSGALILQDNGTQFSVLDGGTLLNAGGTMRLGAGSVLSIGQGGSAPGQPGAGPAAPPAGASFQQSGRLFVSHGARVEIGATQAMDVLGGLVSNEGVIVARGGARITNSGSFQLQTGSRLELDAGSSFDQGAGELLVAAGASISGTGVLNQIGGTTLVDGSVLLPLSIFTGGVLSGTGSFSGAVVLAGTLDLRPGHSPGTLTFHGDLSVEDGVTLQLELDDYRSYDRLVVAGRADIAALRVAVTPGAGYQPDLNDSFQWLQAGQGITGLENVVFDNVPDGWQLLADASGRVDLWNDRAEALPEGGAMDWEVEAGRLAYLSPQRDGAAYGVANTLWISGALAVRPQAVLQVGGPLTVEAGGRLSNRGQIDVVQTLHNRGRVENRDDGVLLLRGSTGLRNEGVLVNSGRLASDGQIVNLAQARIDNHGVMTAPWLRNEGRFTVGGSLVLTQGVNNVGHLEVARGGWMDVGADYIQFDNGTGTPVTRVDGVLVATGGFITISDGILEGAGHIQDTLMLGGDVGSDHVALVRPGGQDEVGTLTVDGISAGRAIFEIDIASTQRFDQLVSQGITIGDGDVRFRLLDGFLPEAGSSFGWLGDHPNLMTTGPGALRWSVSLVRADHSEWLMAGSAGADPAAPLRFSFDGVQLSVTAVPEPATAMLWLLGLIIGGWKVRHTRRATPVPA